MQMGPGEFWYDAATAQTLGYRHSQEDAVIASFPLGADAGFTVLADGMGGHAAGDLAARIVLTEVVSRMLGATADTRSLEVDVPAVLRAAALAADGGLRARVCAEPGLRGMGATLVAVLVLRDALWWISIGDSPLFLFRDGRLRQMNADHSLAPRIDLMLARGMIDADAARNHPDRNVLTSALFGGEIAQIDCPHQALALVPGDIVIAASDGLQFLPDTRIGAILAGLQGASAADVAAAFLAELACLDDPEQDNASVAVIRVMPRRGAHAQMAPIRRAS